MKWLKRWLGGPLWKLEMEARIELAEAMLGDLRERFTRFQNRENMRKARSESDRDAEIQAQAAALIGDPAERVETASPIDKLELWKARRH